LDIICVDSPSGEIAEVSSSYDLSIFSSGVDAQCDESVEATSIGSCLSVEELWPDIDKLDEIQHEDASIVHSRDVAGCRNSMASAEKSDKHSQRSGKKVSLNDAPGLPDIKSKARGKGSAKKKAAQILSAPGTISPRMRRSFIDR
jgi:hypothetical protein